MVPFKSMTQLNNHVRRDHKKEKQHKCNVEGCSYAGGTPNALAVHRARYHPDLAKRRPGRKFQVQPNEEGLTRQEIDAKRKKVHNQKRSTRDASSKGQVQAILKKIRAIFSFLTFSWATSIDMQECNMNGVAPFVEMVVKNCFGMIDKKFAFYHVFINDVSCNPPPFTDPNYEYVEKIRCKCMCNALKDYNNGLMEPREFLSGLMDDRVKWHWHVILKVKAEANLGNKTINEKLKLHFKYGYLKKNILSLAHLVGVFLYIQGRFNHAKLATHLFHQTRVPILDDKQKRLVKSRIWGVLGREKFFADVDICSKCQIKKLKVNKLDAICFDHYQLGRSQFDMKHLTFHRYDWNVKRSAQIGEWLCEPVHGICPFKVWRDKKDVYCKMHPLGDDFKFFNYLTANFDAPPPSLNDFTRISLTPSKWLNCAVLCCDRGMYKYKNTIVEGVNEHPAQDLMTSIICHLKKFRRAEEVCCNIIKRHTTRNLVTPCNPPGEYFTHLSTYVAMANLIEKSLGDLDFVIRMSKFKIDVSCMKSGLSYVPKVKRRSCSPCVTRLGLKDMDADGNWTPAALEFLRGNCNEVESGIFE